MWQRNIQKIPSRQNFTTLKNRFHFHKSSQVHENLLRYVKKKDLRETKALIVTQYENEDAGNVVGDTYDRFHHPETNRLMSMVSVAFRQNVFKSFRLWAKEN